MEWRGSVERSLPEIDPSLGLGIHLEKSERASSPGTANISKPASKSLFPTPGTGEQQQELRQNGKGASFQQL